MGIRKELELVESALAGHVSVDIDAEKLQSDRWCTWDANGLCRHLPKAVSVRHKLLHYLRWWACQLTWQKTPAKNHYIAPNLAVGSTSTFTWTNKRNILKLQAWKGSTHTEVTSICLIWIQVSRIKLCIKTLESPNQTLSFWVSSQQWIYHETSFSKCHLALSQNPIISPIKIKINSKLHNSWYL